MPSLTNDQKLTNQYNELSRQIDTVLSVYYFKMFLDSGLCDNPSDRVRVEGNISIFGNISKPDKPKEKLDRRTLLKDVSEIMLKIKETQAALALESKDQRQSELDLILNTDFEYNYATRVWSGPTGGGTTSNKTKLMVNHEPVKLKYILNTLMPKCVVLDQIDSSLSPAQANLDKLIAKAQKDSKYNNVKFVATEVMTAAAKAREQIVKATSVIDGLKQAEKTIAAVYTDNNNAIFAEHRGNPIVNAAIEVLRKLAGYITFILTYPARLYDNKGTKGYVDSWFEKRQTQSLKVFGTFKEGTTAQNLAKAAGLKTDENTENSDLQGIDPSRK